VSVVEPSTPRRVLVTDAERPSALAMVRSLARRGYWVASASSDPTAPAWRSRASRARVRYPSPDLDPAGAVAAIIRACQRLSIDLVIPVTDDIGLPLAGSGTEMPARLLVPRPDALEVVNDKADTLALARAEGIPVPDTIAVSTVGEAVARANEIGWPIVVKPRRSRLVGEQGVERYTVSYAADRTELAARVAPLEGRVGVLLQRYVQGIGVGVELLLEDGALVAAFQHRRLHEVPVTGGASSLRESVPLDPVLLEHAIRLLRPLSWTGLAMVEFKVGPDGPVLMEVNGRVWGSLPLAVRAGVDFPGLLVDTATGRARAPEAPDLRYRVGVRARNSELELLWIGSVLRGFRRRPDLPYPDRREVIGAAIGLLDPRTHDDVLSLRDPGPGLAMVARLARLVVRKSAGSTRSAHG
jgi:predicted ATP-grasp superfamily ATP-dependent carboligase